MSFEPYSNKVRCLCPVAIKLGQTEVHAPDHETWGVVTCDTCKEQFFIGPDRIHGARTKAEAAAKQLESMLATDHINKRKHQNSYELPD